MNEKLLVSMLVSLVSTQSRETVFTKKLLIEHISILTKTIIK